MTLQPLHEVLYTDTEVQPGNAKRGLVLDIVFARSTESDGEYGPCMMVVEDPALFNPLFKLGDYFRELYREMRTDPGRELQENSGVRMIQWTDIPTEYQEPFIAHVEAMREGYSPLRAKESVV